MKLAIVALLAFIPSVALEPALLQLSPGTTRRLSTNSRASTARGAKAFEKKEYAQAAEAFRDAHELAPSAQTAFNLGTAEIAAGQREQGSATLAAALKDPALRADALFNRGNSALAAKALDHAIRDYKDALRANPQHAAAKRNLEIALMRQQQQQRQSSASGEKQNQGQTPQKPQPAPSPGQQPQKAGQLDLDALLRSVQQQEQDELRRMKAKASGEARVGW
jgi:Ca-activated chloride channel family protein